MNDVRDTVFVGTLTSTSTGASIADEPINEEKIDVIIEPFGASNPTICF
jgi:hypothetical protein